MTASRHPGARSLDHAVPGRFDPWRTSIRRARRIRSASFSSGSSIIVEVVTEVLFRTLRLGDDVPGRILP